MSELPLEPGGLTVLAIRESLQRILAPSYCIAQDVGGTQVLRSFATSSLTATGAVFTYSGIPIVGNTIVVQISCVNQ